jgi:hypothetical protein
LNSDDILFADTELAGAASFDLSTFAQGADQ